MNQEEVWDAIAPEWDEYKKIPAKQVIEFLNTQKGNVLDLGSGSGRNLQKINGKMYLLDFSEEMLKLAEQKAKKEKILIETKKADLTKIPYEENFFEGAICISALHCIKGKSKREKVVKELYRVLKPKAKALIGVWNRNSKRFKGKKPERMIGWTNKGERYYYLFEEDEVHELFKKNGFKITKTLNSEMMINFIVEK